MMPFYIGPGKGGPIFLENITLKGIYAAEQAYAHTNLGEYLAKYHHK